MNYPDSIMIVTRWLGHSPDDLLGTSRKQPLAWGRQLAMYLEKQLHPKKSFTAIGRQFNRDRTTVRHAIEHVADVRGQGEDLDRTLTGIIDRWKRDQA